MSANKIQLQKNDDSVRFIFTDSSHYLTGNGTIDVPVNSLSLVIDKSDMVTFRKAASNDIFVSAPISDFGMSKAEIEEWYAENMVGASGGGIDPETLAELVSSAEYVSSSSTIDFKNVDGDVISTINAEPFITDGMVDNVQISGSNLVITFNVDAGKQPISIPLSSIFDPSNYYDKSATDALLSGKVAVSDYNTYTAATNTALSGKQDTLQYYHEMDDEAYIEIKGADFDNGVWAYVYGVDIYASGDTNVLTVSPTAVTINDDAVVTESMLDDALADKQDTLEYYTEGGEHAVIEVPSNISGVNGVEVFNNGVNIYANENQVGATEVYVSPTGVTINDDAVVTESQLIDYATVASLSGKQDTLIAGSGITISGNVISADGGGGGMSEDDELLLATALVDLNDRKMDTADARAEFAKCQKKGDYITSAVLDTRLADYETALDEQNVEEVASYALNDLNARLTTVETALGGLSLSAITQSQWATISGSANPSTIYIITNNE